MKEVPCNKIKKIAGDYYQNLLPPSLVQRVETHLGECSSCRKLYQETQEVLNLLKQDLISDPGPGFWNGLSSRIMTSVRLIRPEPVKVPWYKKVWEYPFGWPGYAWATALILILLTPVAFYTMKSYKTPSFQEIQGNELKWETGFESLPSAIESLSAKESTRLGKRIVAQMGKELKGHGYLLVEDELHWDVSPSLEGLTVQELDALIKRIKSGKSAGFWEGQYYVS